MWSLEMRLAKCLIVEAEAQIRRFHKLPSVRTFLYQMINRLSHCKLRSLGSNWSNVKGLGPRHYRSG
jgi:hypothetical protein